MQRRSTKAAHISPPTLRDSDQMPHGRDRSSRLNQKVLGVTNRIWLIVSLFLFVLFFTRLILPSNKANSHTYPTAHLRPINYLNGTEDRPNPFPFCPVYGPGDELGAKYSPMTLSQSRLHLGSGARVQRLLQKALKGQPVTISVLGGSISACHGAGDDPLSTQCYPSRFFQWWNTVFPHPASELTNGAMRRTNSEYFSFCNGHHLPDYTDLVILEFDVDDSADSGTLENFELLVRSVLIRPDHPAVIILGHFSPQIHHEHGFSGPDHWHSLVAQFYDVPHVSVKSAIYGDYMANPSLVHDKYYADPVLANGAGHQVMADVLIAYIQSQICDAWAIATGSSYHVDLVGSGTVFGEGSGEAKGLFGGVGQRKGGGAAPNLDSDVEGEIVDNRKITPENTDSDANGKTPALPSYLGVPPARLNTRPDSERAFVEVAPYCVSANDLINPLPPSLFYGSGWKAVHPSTGRASHVTSEHYWYATQPASKLRIPIQAGAGDIGVYYLQEPIDDVKEGSAVECWVDDNYAGAKVIENSADVKETTPVLELIDRHVSRGPHFVECMLQGTEGEAVPPFKIVGIFST